MIKNVTDLKTGDVLPGGNTVLSVSQERPGGPWRVYWRTATGRKRSEAYPADAQLTVLTPAEPTP